MANLGELIQGTLLGKLGDSILPTTIKGKLETGWMAFDRFCPIELGTSVMLWGPSQSGKSLMMMMLGASVQQKGGLFVCFNTEAANRDSDHLKRVIPSLDYGAIKFFQPNYIEHTIDSIHTIVDMTSIESAPVFISIDSINACATKREMESSEFVAKDMSGAEIAGIWSNALRQLTNKLSKKPVVLCLVSQSRTGGIGSYRTFEKPGGGAAPYFHASTVLRTKGMAFLYDGANGNYTKTKKHSLQEKAAQECSLDLQKSRYSSGGSTLDYVIDFKQGINPYEGLVDMLVFYNIIQTSGSWYSYNGEQLGQGKVKTKEAIMNNADLAKELIAKLNNF